MDLRTYKMIFRRIAAKKGYRAVAAIALSIFLWQVCKHLVVPGKQPAAASEETATPETAVGEQDNLPVYHIVKSGETFSSILAGFGVAPAHAIRYFHALKSGGLTAIFPGDSMVVRFGNDSLVDTLALLSRLSCWHRIIRDSLGIRTEKDPVQIVRHRCLIRGTLSSSLSEDIHALGAGDALVAAFADIFAWDINFFLDPRKGDRFEMIFERVYAEGRCTGYGAVLAAAYYGHCGTYYAFGMRDGDGRMSYYDENGKSVQKQFLKAPLRYSRISSRFSYHRKHPILGIVRPHLGVDYAAPVGTPVYAAADGTVRFCGIDGGFGKIVRIDHGAAYETSYGHLHTFGKSIRKGTRVRQGDCIGTVGSTGLATGPHLDYRFRISGRFVDPLTLKLPSKKGVSPDQWTEFILSKHHLKGLLSLRFPGMEGYRVLDICVQPQKPRRAHDLVEGESADGNRSGS
jgi:murein DD-endopeptidase MepM/ murein hydrolase activator NlpD